MSFSGFVILTFLFLSTCVSRKPKAEVQSTTAKDIIPWPNAIVPYEIEASIPTKVHKLIEDAIKIIGDLNIVTFVETNGDFEKFPVSLIFSGAKSGCRSLGFGFKTEQSTVIKISEDCTPGNTLHEILHGLGLLHEQVNPKANIKILTSRIQSGMEDQFTQSDAKALTVYDPASIMHYASEDFTICDSLADEKWKNSALKKDLPDTRCKRKDWRTVVPTAQSPLDCMRECAVMFSANNEIIKRQRTKLSPKDIEGLKALYPK